MNPGGYGGPPYGPGGAPPQPGAPGQQQGYQGAPQAGYPGQPGAYPGQMPGGYPQPGAYPGQMPPQQMPMQQMPPQQMPMQQPAYNPYGNAQRALGNASGTIKMLQYVFTGLGGLMAVGGLVMLFAVGFGAGLGLIITGVVLVATAWLFLPQFSGMLGGATEQVNALAQKAHLAQTGMPASGRILQIQMTGTLVNYNPEVRALVEVQHPQMGVYQVQTTAVIPQISIPQFQPGAQVAVRINPQNPQDIALVT